MLTKVSTRQRAVFVAIFMTIVFLAYHQLAFANTIKNIAFGEFLFPSITALLMAFGVSWMINFKFTSGKFFSIVLFSVMNIFVLSLFYELLIEGQSNVGKITILWGSVIIFFVVNYLTLLMMNVINVAYDDNIPLGQAGIVATYFLNLLVQYLAFFMLFSREVNPWVRYMVVFGLAFFSTYSLLWQLKTAYVVRFLSAFGIALALSTLGLILNIWPIDNVIWLSFAGSTGLIALILCFVSYVLLGIALEVKEIISDYVWLEYGFIMFSIVFFILLASKWGINGYLI